MVDPVISTRIPLHDQVLTSQRPAMMADRELRAKSLPENHPQLKGAVSPKMPSPTGADGIR